MNTMVIARFRAPVGASIRPHVPPAARRVRRRRLACELVMLAVVVLGLWGLA